jgi:hypothetical protein
MGLLRILLHLLAFAFILILPFAEPSWNPQGWDLILGAVVPALAPMIFIIIMLDVLMCKVFQTDAQDLLMKQRYGLIARTNFSIAVVLLLFWLAAFQDALF